MKPRAEHRSRTAHWSKYSSAFLWLVFASDSIGLKVSLYAPPAPAAANFRFRGITDASKAPERVKLPIRGFLGDKDAYKTFLDEQWADAAKFARENGYENLTLTEVPGASHQAFPDQRTFLTAIKDQRSAQSAPGPLLKLNVASQAWRYPER